LHTWLSIGFPVCAVLTGGGLVLSWRLWRRAGARRGLRAAGWSLAPLGIYLAGALTLVWRIGSAVTRFAGSFVLSPKSWAGVGMLGVAALILLTTGGFGLRGGRRAGRKKGVDQAPDKRAAAGQSSAGAAALGAGSARSGEAGAPRAKAPAGKRGRPGKNAAADNLSDPDMADVAEILRRRGIK
jgi:hypothetical protein